MTAGLAVLNKSSVHHTQGAPNLLSSAPPAAPGQTPSRWSRFSSVAGFGKCAAISSSAAARLRPRQRPVYPGPLRLDGLGVTTRERDGELYPARKNTKYWVTTSEQRQSHHDLGHSATPVRRLLVHGENDCKIDHDYRTRPSRPPQWARRARGGTRLLNVPCASRLSAATSRSTTFEGEHELPNAVVSSSTTPRIRRSEHGCSSWRWAFPGMRISQGIELLHLQQRPRDTRCTTCQKLSFESRMEFRRFAPFGAC